MSPDYSSLIPLLSSLIERVGDSGLHVNVSLTDSQEILDLRQQIQDLQSANSDLIARCNRAEFLARCDSVICMRVVDYARDHGLRIPRKLYDGLDSFK